MIFSISMCYNTYMYVYIFFFAVFTILYFRVKSFNTFAVVQLFLEFFARISSLKARS